VNTDQTRSTTDWLQPGPESGGLKRTLQTIRERIWLIIACLALMVGAAVIYVTTVEPVYEAEADILVLPVPADETLLRSLGLIPESNDPTLDVETASQLIDTPEVAGRAGGEGVDSSAEEILDSVQVEPLPESNIVAIVASASTAAQARDLANSFATAAVEVRTDQLHDQIEVVLPRLQGQIDTLPAGDAASELAGGRAETSSPSSSTAIGRTATSWARSASAAPG